MAAVGDVISIPNKGKLPKAPAGTHWQFVGFIAGDVGQLDEYELVANDQIVPSGVGTQLTQQLTDAFTRGFLSFFGATGVVGGSDTVSGHTRAITFWVKNSLETSQWVVDTDCNIIGASLPASSMFSFVPMVYGTVPAPGSTVSTRVFSDIILVAGASSSYANFGVLKFPLFNGQRVYFGPTNPNTAMLIVQNL